MFSLQTQFEPLTLFVVFQVVGFVIVQLFGLEPFRILSAAAGVLRLVPIRKHHVFRHCADVCLRARAITLTQGAGADVLFAGVGHCLSSCVSSVTFFSRGVLLRLVAGLAAMVVLVVVAIFLIGAAATDREFTLPRVSVGNMGFVVVLAGVFERLFHLSFIRHVGLAL